jgi:hypothetical protein
MSSLDPSLSFESSARRDIRWWGLFVAGLVFWIAGNSIDPRENCSDNGECAPWLVPLAAGMGALALCGGAAMLIANPRRGCRVNAATGMLHWWQGRRGGQLASEEGGIAIAKIARIRVVNTSDSDHIYFYRADGALLPLPENEAFPWPYQDWAGRLVRAYPHIELTVVGS